MINNLSSAREHFRGVLGKLKTNSFMSRRKSERASKRNKTKEIELAIIHSFVNNDKWRLFYVYLDPIGERRIKKYLKQKLLKEELKKEG